MGRPKPHPVLLLVLAEEAEQSSGGPAGWGPFWPWKGNCSQAPSAWETAVPFVFWAIRGERMTTDPFSRHAPRVVHLMRRVRSRRASAHVTSSFFPPPPWLLSPTSGQLGRVGAAFKKSTFSPQCPVRAITKPHPLPDSGGATIQGDPLRPGVQALGPWSGALVQGGSKFVIISSWGSGGMGSAGGAVFLPRLRFPPSPSFL